MGFLASVVGLFLGLALAKLLFWLFGAVGFTLPNTGLLFKPRTVVVCLVVGIARDDAREPPARAARDPGAADRGRARRRDAAAGPLRQATAASARRRSPCSGFLPLAYGHRGERAAPAPVLALHGRRRRARSSSASRCSRRS